MLNDSQIAQLNSERPLHQTAANDVRAFRQIAVSELHIGAISEIPVLPTQHETFCLPLRISKSSMQHPQTQ